MTFAFILINTIAGSEEKVVEKMRSIKGISEIHTVYGTFDIIAKIQIEEPDDRMKEEITWKIRGIKEVQSTTTLIVAKSY
uniref:Lrp/AsnC family transcriptional regulator n=1 Tax=Candidatus Methanomethylicus mesodigestus TaxID=1867258 RepID=A0A7C3ESU3_9CREN